MKVVLFSIRDTKAGCYLSPFVSRSQVDALRQITASLRNPDVLQTPLGQHPADFELFSVGYFDDESGHISACEPAFVSTIAALAASGTVSS